MSPHEDHKEMSFADWLIGLMVATGFIAMVLFAFVLYVRYEEEVIVIKRAEVMQQAKEADANAKADTGR